MQLVTALKKAIFSDDQPALTPDRTALRQHLRALQALQTKRHSVTARDQLAQRDIDAEQQAAAVVNAKRIEIDQLRANARYLNEGPPDVAALQRALDNATAIHGQLSNRAREAQHLRPRFAADIAELNATFNALQPQTPRLMWAALVEEMNAHATEFLEAEARLKAIHRKAFTAALAADRIALDQKYGEFQSSALFYELSLTKPQTAAFNPHPLSPDASHAARREDSAALEREAERLTHDFLTSERQN